ncbi:hypothetical protein QFZ77_000018 [Paenibacillus sp. V4I3]|uniref:TnsD family Tn7-like transposition protein n=1 Tax=Paenibacillus sp. V4I3 TaxID=3042305 RepID=UPI00277EA688|nr:TnsD family Tn7-like transposition protein [Paenibacillus sp. V4I3]MDQ0871359.1 hypothetical protein [Paenibacillus sp. V4I3]
MIFFPELLPDELFYSCCARYHNESSNESILQSLKDLFGVAHTEINCHFPSRLNNFVTTCNKKNWDISIESIIGLHTIYPFFHPFLDKGQSENIFKMIEGTLIYRPHFILGIKNKFWTSVLNYCPDCIKEDDLEYGFPYWHRLHQVPGMLYCPTHCKRLKNSCPSCNLKFETHNILLILPRYCTCGCDLSWDRASQIISLDEYRAQLQLISISKDIAYLFKSYDIVGQRCSFRQLYKEYLSKTTYSSLNGRLKQRDLTNDFMNFYSKSTLALLQCDISHINWIQHLFNKNYNHPLKHVLFIRFLFGSVIGMIQEVQKVA